MPQESGPYEGNRDGSIERPRSASELLKFTALAALLAISADAAIAHAMLWGNDPYWTYWVTDTLLMATVFGLGTAWLGMGLLRGLLVTVVHMLLLTTYYWTLSPIGLPGQPEWLDLERTWLTGLPVHTAVYYLGYVLALWLWRRRPAAPAAATRERAHVATPPRPLAGLATATGIAVVIAMGLVQTLVTQEFPGVSWFVMRIAVAVPVTFAWWTLAGRDRAASIAGGLALGFTLITYGHYLGPVGLPDPSLRLLTVDPPSATVHWLSYRQEFLLLLPLALGLAVGAFLVVSRWRPEPSRNVGGKRGSRLLLGAAVLALAGVGAWSATHTGPAAHRTTVTSLGEPKIALGTGAAIGVQGAMRMTAENRSSRRTPLPPHDRVTIAAQVRMPNGTTHAIRATQPMVREPHGRFTTWNGVGFDVWHHGRSGIGTLPRPPVHSEVAAFSLGSLSTDGRVVATGVPVHVMTDTASGTIELHFGDAATPLPGVPGGRLQLAWPDYDGGDSRMLTNARYAWGSSVLLVLLLWTVAAARRQRA